VGVSIAGLSLALGAFFLGMSVRKKSRSSVDIESVSDRGKPELDSKTIYQEKVTPELYADVAPIQAQAHETGDTFKTVLEANELTGQPTQDVPAERTELNTSLYAWKWTPQNNNHDLKNFMVVAPKILSHLYSTVSTPAWHEGTRTMIQD
jgi:hypothetical protein